MTVSTIASKVLTLISFTLASTFTQAQQPESFHEFKKISIGLSFSPDYSSRTLKNESRGTTGNDLQIRNHYEVAKMGYTTGLNMLIPFSKHLAFETGIQYANKGYQTKKVDFIYETPNTSSPANGRTVYTYQYIGIPLHLKYLMGKGRLGFHTGIGLVPSFLVKAKQLIVLEYSNGKRERERRYISSGFEKIDLSAIVNLGLHYHFNDKLLLLAEPTYRYGILKVKDASISEKLWNAGLNIGFRYALK